MTLELFNESFALGFYVGIHIHLARRKFCYCKEVPILIFPLMFWILISERETKTHTLCKCYAVYLNWAESSMPVFRAGSNCKPKENLFLKTSLSYHFGVASLEWLTENVDAHVSGLANHCSLPEQTCYWCSSID